MNSLFVLVDYLILIKFYIRTFTIKQRYCNRIFAVLYSSFNILVMILCACHPMMYHFVTSILLLNSCLFAEDNLFNKLTCMICLFGTRVLSGFMGITLARTLLEGENVHVLIPMSHICLARMLSNILTYISVSIWCIKVKNRHDKVDRRTASIAMVVLTMTIIGAYVLYRMLFLTGHANICRAYMMVLVILFGIHYLMILAMEKSNMSLVEIYTHKMREQERNFEENYLRELQGKVNELTKIRHDYKNQLLALLAVRERDKECLAEEIQLILQEMEKTDQVIYTENYVVNAICKSKFLLAKASNIQVDCQLSIPHKMNIPCNELGIIFGNLLDNAVEACQKASSEGKIRLAVRLKEEKLLILLENTSIVYENTNQMISTKKDKENHGFGLKSVKRVVEKYNGQMQMENKNSLFQTKILMYGIKAIS